MEIENINSDFCLIRSIEIINLMLHIHLLLWYEYCSVQVYITAVAVYDGCKQFVPMMAVNNLYQ